MAETNELNITSGLLFFGSCKWLALRLPNSPKIGNRARAVMWNAAQSGTRFRE